MGGDDEITPFNSTTPQDPGAANNPSLSTQDMDDAIAASCGSPGPKNALAGMFLLGMPKYQFKILFTCGYV